MGPRLIATLATNHAWEDLQVFVATLTLWNRQPSQEAPTIYLACDRFVADRVDELRRSYQGRIVTRVCLEPYTGLTRSEMEATRLPHASGRPDFNLFFQFTLEKISLLEWVFDEEPSAANDRGVFFFDADICWLGPLPEVPASADVVLSPHLIRPEDERRYGVYNAGFLWTRSREALILWRTACETSHFFEQAALEVFDQTPGWEGRVAQFPVQHNYGWWRLWQGRRPPAELQAEWTVFRDPDRRNAGLRVAGAPLGSIHTHWQERRDMATAQFNRFVVQKLQLIAKTYGPAAALLRCLPPSSAATAIAAP